MAKLEQTTVLQKGTEELDDFGVFDYQRRGKTEWLVMKIMIS